MRISLAVSIAAVVALMFVTGWMSDDAYITLRVVANLWDGYGLRWNALERVQVFTHPLWMLILAAAYGVTREAFWTTIALSLSLSAAALVLLTRRAALETAGAVAALALVAASKSVVEFSTSGLENPLSHVLLVGFFVTAWRGSLTRAACLGGLCGLCRLDLVVLVGPTLAVAAWRHRDDRRRLVHAAMLAAAPVLAWWAFAFVYYGSIWPNTAFAKLPANVGLVERAPQGARYLVDAAIADPVTVLVLGAALVRSWWRGGDRAMALGLTAALAYVVAIGGDFMTGRFLSAPTVVAITWLAHDVRWRWPQAGAVAAASLALSVAMPQSPLRIWQRPGDNARVVTHGAGIVDERTVYASYTGVLAVLGGSHPSRHPWARGGRAMAGVPTVAVYEAVGLLGYHAGPAVHIVDPMALTDPFLARRPANQPWRIGHFRRFLPRGYVERLRGCVSGAFPGNAVQPPTRTCLDTPAGAPPMDAAVGADYDAVARVTQLPLFHPQRTAQLRRMMWP
jgi:arabinofuranosyltransferase